jgi:hypothetical protein
LAALLLAKVARAAQQEEGPVPRSNAAVEAWLVVISREIFRELVSSCI